MVYAKSGPGQVIELLARAGKYKLGARAVKYNFGARTGKSKLGTRASKYKLLAKATGRELGPSKGLWAGKYKDPADDLQ